MVQFSLTRLLTSMSLIAVGACSLRSRAIIKRPRAATVWRPGLEYSIAAIDGAHEGGTITAQEYLPV